MLLTFLSQPTLYSMIAAILLAFYLVWALARQQYLGTIQQFNVLTLSLLGGALAAFICQLLYPGYLILPLSLGEAWHSLSQPWTIHTVTLAYIVAILVSWRYLAKIHYPFWRMMDSNVLGVTLVGLGWMIGRLITTPNWPMAGLTGGLTLVLMCLLFLYQKTQKQGIVSSVHLIAIFALVLVSQYMLVPWHGWDSTVEYLPGATMLIMGVVAFVIRLRWQVPQLTLTQLPAGVSQKFRETYSTLISRQSASGGLFKKHH